ncbi:VWA domain-containing protein [Pseudonocardia humida]|uniref:VWA domain-containing protein n=1 Tax=Pseudonocardia humida TaxID=2800819 RepID=A0ABT0ZRW2_9PSEU|nr:VWA domain-containing protein [Pseudonocardia humida]MCO1653435.1 VWA domain-containing protein [Pseudonocardia humida]
MLRFLEPGWLWLLLLAPVLVTGYLLESRRRGRDDRTVPVRIVGPGGPARRRARTWPRHLRAAAFLLAVVAVVLALAQPVGVVPGLTTREGTVVVALDVSNSMEATDVAPSRLAAATEAARTFVSAVPADFQVGLVLFAGSADIAVRPSRDRAALLAELTEPRLRSGTAIGDAVLRSVDAVRGTLLDPAADRAPARIVLLSDGDSTNGAPLAEAAAAATAADIPVSTIAYGTQKGVTSTGTPVPVDTDALAELAAATGGQPYLAETADQLRAAYADIGQAIGDDGERPLITAVLLVALGAALLNAAGSLTAAPRPA